MLSCRNASRAAVAQTEGSALLPFARGGAVPTPPPAEDKVGARTITGQFLLQ
jgi:hypothetical protein